MREVAIIGYHVATGVTGGATALGNLAISSLFALLFFLKSRGQ